MSLLIKRLPRRFPQVGWAVLYHAHWLLGALLLVAVVAWTQTEIGGAWSSENRKPLYLANVLMLYVLVAMGLNIVSGYAGAASIGHIALYGTGAYTMAILTTKYGWEFLPAVLMGAVVGMILALPVGLILLRLSGWYFSVVTLLLTVVVNDLWIHQKHLTGGGAGLFGITMPSLGDEPLSLKEYLYLLVGLNVVVFLLLRHLVECSRWGRALVAVRDVEPVARAVGVHPFMVRQSALAISGFLAGLAGALFPPLPAQINPESFPILDSIFFLLAVLAGGMGTVAGPVIGTLFLYTLPLFLAEQEGLRRFSFLIYGALLLLLVVFLPEGIVGGVRRLWYQLVRPRRPVAALFGDVPVDGRAEASAEAGAAAREVTLAHLIIRRSMDAEYAVEAEGITKQFGELVALRELTVRVRPGTVHAIIGPNGSGKTTLLNIISGFYKQDSGSVRVFGRYFPRGGAVRAIRFGLARTFQAPQVLPQLTVVENVMLGCHAWGRATFLDGMLPLPHVCQEQRRFRETAMACLDLVGLGRGAAELSCGQLPFARQRLVEIARALAGRPQVLLLDEPVSGLHVDEVQIFIRLMRELKAAGLTAILVEHNLGLVAELADTITVLDAGVCLAEGSFEEVRSNPQVVEAYLGRTAESEGQPKEPV